MKIRFLGAASTVTGSKYLIEARNQRVLVDCGLFQGWKSLRLKNWEIPPFPVEQLNAVILTHAHIDHSGFLPKLYSLGYRGPVYCSPATRDLCEILLPDAGYIQEEEAEYANRRGFSKHKPALPLYTIDDAKNCLRLFRAVNFHERFDLGAISFELFHAGHILGAAMIRLSDGRRSVFFSGDVGRSDDLLLRAPEPIPDSDVLIVESTYGDRIHPGMDPLVEVERVVCDVVSRRGVVIVPAFAVGRTQSLLYILWKLQSSGRIPKVPVYLNSPMATDTAELLCAHGDELIVDRATCANIRSIATCIRSPEESKALNQKTGPMIIVSASGMAGGGRVLHHLKAFIGNENNAVLFTGFQAGGTRGAALVAGAKQIKIHGEYHAVRARIENLNMLSAHADSNELFEWCSKVKRPPKKMYITHGEPSSADAFRIRVKEGLGWEAEVPLLGDVVDLSNIR